MFIHDINPVLLQLGPLSIRYYGLVYAFGFLLATHIIVKAVEKGKIKNLDKERAIDMCLYAMIALVVGARIYHVITKLPFYLSNPLKIFAVWGGGMAFFGGFIGIVVYIYYFTKKNNIKLLNLGDILILPIPFILGVGRIANFINAEHVGYISNLPWAVKFPGYEGFRHPAQIYESISMFLLFFIMYFISKRKTKKGTLILTFVFFYGVFRFITEFFRDNGEFLGIFTYSQWMSLVFIVTGAYFFKKLYKVKIKT